MYVYYYCYKHTYMYIFSAFVGNCKLMFVCLEIYYTVV